MYDQFTADLIKENSKLHDQNRRLRAVIDEIPEEFEGICRYSKGEFNFVDFSEPTTKSLLLAKHGVEG